MFFLSKVAWALVEPGNLLLLLLLSGSVLLFLGGGRACAGRVLVVAATVGFTAVAMLPLADWVARPLESRFPHPGYPPRVDGIIMLGGAVQPRLSRDRGEASLNQAAERLFAFVELGRRYPGARMVSSGGSGSVRHPDLTEDAAVRRALEQVGFDTGRVIFENRSRNTWENAVFSRDLVDPAPGETWILVTSGIHMPRSMGIFERIGWRVLPYPVDYRTSQDPRFWVHFDLEENLAQLSDAVREWIGLAAYRVMGRTDALFPGPRDGG